MNKDKSTFFLIIIQMLQLGKKCVNKQNLVLK